jgi:hypothetical protein
MDEVYIDCVEGEEFVPQRKRNPPDGAVHQKTTRALITSGDPRPTFWQVFDAIKSGAAMEVIEWNSNKMGSIIMVIGDGVLSRSTACISMKNPIGDDTVTLTASVVKYLLSSSFDRGIIRAEYDGNRLQVTSAYKLLAGVNPAEHKDAARPLIPWEIPSLVTSRNEAPARRLLKIPRLTYNSAGLETVPMEVSSEIPSMKAPGNARVQSNLDVPAVPPPPVPTGDEQVRKIVTSLTTLLTPHIIAAMKANPTALQNARNMVIANGEIQRAIIQDLKGNPSVMTTAVKKLMEDPEFNAVAQSQSSISDAVERLMVADDDYIRNLIRGDMK